MKNLKLLTLIFLGFNILNGVAIAPPNQNRSIQDEVVNARVACTQGLTRRDLGINNVRAAIWNSGDLWWTREIAGYIVPNVAPPAPQVASIFAGGVWIGGRDPAGVLKIAASTFPNGGRTDYYPGPISIAGITTKEICDQWNNEIFRVTSDDIRNFQLRFDLAKANGKLPLDDDAIPLNIKRWPARGNPYFKEFVGFDLPIDNQDIGLAYFYDEDDDGDYNPALGDFPIIDLDCRLAGVTKTDLRRRFPDEMLFTVYNDEGNGARHTQTNGATIRIEVQQQAFAYKTGDDLNNMTFIANKLVNRAPDVLRDCYFAMWVDPDLGCYDDDFVGCNVERSLGYIYNRDGVDGTGNTTACPQNTPTYGTRIPVIGVDYFRGPRFADSLGNIVELGMSSFTYYYGIGAPNPQTSDPQQPEEYYNFITGRWKDREPYTIGGIGRSGTIPTKYVFPDEPCNPAGWSCVTGGIPQNADLRTMQATGPIILLPGTINELIVGLPWVPDIPHPNPCMTRLFAADDLAQALFDNCFEAQQKPEPPTSTTFEGCNQVTLALTNDTTISNNAFEAFAEPGIFIPKNQGLDSIYRFEGYIVFQTKDGSQRTFEELQADKNLGRIVAQCDVKNGISSIFDYIEKDDPANGAASKYFEPILRVQGADKGIEHIFNFTKDAFSESGQNLVNNRRYFYQVFAYAYNNFRQFNPRAPINAPTGQRTPFLVGNSSPVIVAIPRCDRQNISNCTPGTPIAISRFNGVGNDNNFLDMTDESRDANFNGTSNGKIDYKAGSGPFDVQIFNPDVVRDGDYEFIVRDANTTDNVLERDATWVLVNKATGKRTALERGKSLATSFQQIIPDLGITVTIANGQNPGTTINNQFADNNGVVGSELVYKNPAGPQWLGYIQDQLDGNENFFPPGTQSFQIDFVRPIFDFIKNAASAEPLFQYDPNQNFQRLIMTPYRACYSDPQAVNPRGYFLTPAFTSSSNFGVPDLRNDTIFASLRNVDVILTKDTSKWTRVPVIETAGAYHTSTGVIPNPNGNITGVIAFESFDLKTRPSLEKFTNTSGEPVVASGETGYSWFPGYAIDVETGERLNMMFGENSLLSPGSYRKVFGALQFPAELDSEFTGNDMIFNPSNRFIYPNLINQAGPNSTIPIEAVSVGCQHHFYVLNTRYDRGVAARALVRFQTNRAITNARKQNFSRIIQYAVTPMPLSPMLSLKDGLIPNDVTIKLRVSKRFGVTPKTTNHPVYGFTINACRDLTTAEVGANAILDNIGVVPNPYYGFSSYENRTLDNIVKLTNLPYRCKVTIYSIDGRFIREFNRNESPIDYPVGDPAFRNPAFPSRTVNPSIEWNLRNSAGIPIASGVYLIHVDAPGIGQKTLKWFGVPREFDASGL
jgi:hypothetical protein